MVIYFEALGLAIQRGRGLEPPDASDAGNPAVLTDQAWARLFGRDPAALGRALDLNGRAFTIVGVLAPAFTGLGDLPRDVLAAEAAHPLDEDDEEGRAPVRSRKGGSAGVMAKRKARR